MSAALFGSEYFDQALELDNSEAANETGIDENLTKPDTAASKIDPFRSLSLSQQRCAQIEARIAAASGRTFADVSTEPEPDEHAPRFRLVGRRAAAGYDGVAVSDWDPFNH
jgi:hypothetical protein